MSPNQIHEGISKLASVVNEVSLWAVKSGLCLNPSKTQAILFASPHFTGKAEKMGLSGIDLGYHYPIQ